MKKIISIVFALMLFISIVGCIDRQPSSQTNKNILHAWTGDFSEEKLKNAIDEYQRNYDNIVFHDTTSASSVSFDTDFNVVSCSVTRLSHTKTDDIYAEFNTYIDLFVETECDGKTVTIHTDWYLTENDGSWEKNYPVWSYLVQLKDADSITHYYYFRVDYSALFVKQSSADN